MLGLWSKRVLLMLKLLVTIDGGGSSEHGESNRIIFSMIEVLSLQHRDIALGWQIIEGHMDLDRSQHGSSDLGLAADCPSLLQWADVPLHYQVFEEVIWVGIKVSHQSQVKSNVWSQHSQTKLRFGLCFGLCSGSLGLGLMEVLVKFQSRNSQVKIHQYEVHSHKLWAKVKTFSCQDQIEKANNIVQWGPP